MPGELSAADLREQLGRWVGEGLISLEQARSIEDAEAARDRQPPAPSGPGPAAPSRRASFVVEALGYLGGALAFVAGFITLRQLWPDIPTGVELAFAAAATVLLFGAGAAIGATGDGSPAWRRSWAPGSPGSTRTSHPRAPAWACGRCPRCGP